MFNNIIYFIIVLLIYYIAYPSKTPENSLYYTLAMLFLAWLAFGGYCRWVFRRFLDRFKEDAEEHGRLTGEYLGLVFRLSILAIFLFAVDINFFSLKYWLQIIPGLNHFSVLQGVLALSLFFVYLGTIWYFSHAAYKVVFHTEISRKSFILSNFRLNIPILFPWLLLSTSYDLLSFTPWGGDESFLNRPVGQFVFFAIFLTILMIFLPQLIQYWWGCRPFRASDRVGELKAFLHEKGLKYRDILRWPIFEGRMMTAGIMGIIPRYRYILITDALMEILSIEELKAVVAHEMGHAKYRHLLFYIIFFLGFMVLTISLFNLEDAGVYVFLVDYFFNRFSISVSGHTFLLIYGLSILVTIFIYFRYVMGFFMRNFERQADLHAAVTMGTPRPAISSLEKIAVLSGKSRDLPSWHHFSIKQRVDFLWRILSEPRLVRRHHRFVAISFVGYLVCIVGLGYFLNFSPVKRSLGYAVIIKTLERQLIKEPDNMMLYENLAMAYHEMGKFDKAIETYERVIAVDQSRAVALNNLAWLLLTVSEEGLRDKKRALRLARSAVGLERSPVFLDTLAEAYYANGMIPEAIKTIKEAITRATENRNYYEKQLRKFTTATGRR